MDANAQRYQDAGLVGERFETAGSPPFPGYHAPDKRWNGWATPGFTEGTAALIANWLNDGEADSAWWDGATLVHRTGGFTKRITPDDLGLYRFEGWMWMEAK